MKNNSIRLAAASLGASLWLTGCFNTGAEAPVGEPSKETPSAEAPARHSPADLTIEQARAIIEAGRNGTARPELEKGKYILKEGETAPQDGLKDAEAVLESTEGTYLMRDGKWSLEKPLAKSSVERYYGGYITQIKLIAGSSSGITCPSGYTKVDVDLNRRAGGKWIYFCAAGGSPGAALELMSVRTWGQGSYGTGPGAISPFSGNGDMNEGAAGDFVFGTYSGAPWYHCQVTGIGVITSSTFGAPFLQPPTGWTHLYSTIDLNKRAGGDFIYLVLQYQRGNPYVNCLGNYDNAGNWYGPTGW